MMRTVHLYGKLADEFGPSFNLDVATPAEAVRALSANFGHRFLSMIRAGEWHVVAGDSLDEGDDFGTSEEMLFFGLGKSDLHIAPAMRGSGKGGFFQVVLGIALVATAFFMAPPTIGALGPTMGMGLDRVYRVRHVVHLRQPCHDGRHDGPVQRVRDAIADPAAFEQLRRPGEPGGKAVFPVQWSQEHHRAGRAGARRVRQTPCRLDACIQRHRG